MDGFENGKAGRNRCGSLAGVGLDGDVGADRVHEILNLADGVVISQRHGTLDRQFF